MRKLCRTAALGICTVLALLTVLLVLPGLFGIHPLLIRGKSMEPSYPDGGLVYIRWTEPEQMKEGDPVTFFLEDEKTLVTHRIVRIDREERKIYTKGDANPEEDGIATTFEWIAGSPVACVPVLGNVAELLSGAPGKLGILLAVVTVCVLSWIDGALCRQESVPERKL